MMDHFTQAKVFARILKTQFKKRLVSVVLFGSVGRGDYRPGSDIDLLIVIEGLAPTRLARRAELDAALDAAIKVGVDAPVNCHLKTPEEAKHLTVMYFDLPYDAKILHDTNGFFKKIVDDVKKKIKINGSVRKRIGRFYYWDLKPGAHADDTFEIL